MRCEWHRCLSVCRWSVRRGPALRPGPRRARRLAPLSSRHVREGSRCKFVPADSPDGCPRGVLGVAGVAGSLENGETFQVESVRVDVEYEKAGI